MSATIGQGPLVDHVPRPSTSGVESARVPHRREGAAMSNRILWKTGLACTVVLALTACGELGGEREEGLGVSIDPGQRIEFSVEVDRPVPWWTVRGSFTGDLDELRG